MDFDRKEDGTQKAGHNQPDLRPQHVAALAGDKGEAAGEAREEQAAGLDRDLRPIEQILAHWSAVGGVNQRRVAREQGREHDDVGENEEPEAIGYDDALRLRATMAEAG